MLIAASDIAQSIVFLNTATSIVWYHACYPLVLPYDSLVFIIHCWGLLLGSSTSYISLFLSALHKLGLQLPNWWRICTENPFPVLSSIYSSGKAPLHSLADFYDSGQSCLCPASCCTAIWDAVHSGEELIQTLHPAHGLGFGDPWAQSIAWFMYYRWKWRDGWEVMK